MSQQHRSQCNCHCWQWQDSSSCWHWQLQLAGQCNLRNGIKTQGQTYHWTSPCNSTHYTATVNNCLYPCALLTLWQERAAAACPCWRCPSCRARLAAAETAIVESASRTRAWAGWSTSSFPNRAGGDDCDVAAASCSSGVCASWAAQTGNSSAILVKTRVAGGNAGGKTLIPGSTACSKQQRSSWVPEVDQIAAMTETSTSHRAHKPQVTQATGHSLPV
jgi:hypothetical protein